MVIAIRCSDPCYDGVEYSEYVHKSFDESSVVAHKPQKYLQGRLSNEEGASYIAITFLQSTAVPAQPTI